MKRLLSLILCLVGLTLLGIAGWPRPEIKAAIPQVVQIERYCSGIIAGKNLVLTAGHCFALQRPVPTFATVYFVGRKSEVFQIAYVSYEKGQPDFAILVGDTHGIEPAPIAESSPRFHDFVAYSGHGQGAKYQMGIPGMIIDPSEADGGTYVIEFAANVVPGDSGSGLINQKGELIGIVIRSRYPTPVGEATPIRYVAKTLRRIGLSK